jgi:hypothetical protein
VAIGCPQEAVRHDVNVCVGTHDFAPVVISKGSGTAKRRASRRRHRGCARSVELNECALVMVWLRLCEQLNGDRQRGDQACSTDSVFHSVLESPFEAVGPYKY